MGIQLETDIKELLVSWGHWAASCTEKTECGSYRQQPFVQRSSGSIPTYQEKDMLKIDQAIAKLFSRDEQIQYLFVYYYQHRYTLRELVTLFNKVYERGNDKQFTVNYLKVINDNATAMLKGYLVGKWD